MKFNCALVLLFTNLVLADTIQERNVNELNYLAAYDIDEVDPEDIKPLVFTEDDEIQEITNNKNEVVNIISNEAKFNRNDEEYIGTTRISRAPVFDMINLALSSTWSTYYSRSPIGLQIAWWSTFLIGEIETVNNSIDTFEICYLNNKKISLLNCKESSIQSIKDLSITIIKIIAAITSINITKKLMNRNNKLDLEKNDRGSIKKLPTDHKNVVFIVLMAMLLSIYIGWSTWVQKLISGLINSL